MTLVRDWIPSPNYSSRGGATVRLLIVHTAEGALTFPSLGAFFANPSADVSSHVGIDDTPGRIGEYVKPDMNAWCAGNVNSYADQVELCAFAAWTRADWLSHPVMLDNLRAWLAEESARFGIPLVKSTEHGVCGHVDVSGPGGHWDPGPEFPWDVVLGPAGAIPASVLAYASGQEDAAMALTTGPDGSRVDLLFVAVDGSVHHWWAPDPAGLADERRRSGEMLGGQVRDGGGVSGGWTADHAFYVVACEGTDDRSYLNWTPGDGNWSGWHPLGDGGTLRAVT